MSKTYFAKDGSFGAADGLIVIDTSEWTQDDWDAVESGTDQDRAVVALHISKQYDGEVETR